LVPLSPIKSANLSTTPSRFPKKPRDPGIDLYTHAISGTPFAVIYDFDDTELRVFFIVHGHTDRARIHTAGVEW
jgi:mRNA-degrading endonuclease RelE of RelBE toxin-antitoxin system